MWERQILRRGPRYIVHASWNLQARVPQSPLTFRRQRLRRDVCLSCMRVDGCSLFCVSMRASVVCRPWYMNCLRCSSMPCRPWLGRVPVLTIINGNFRFLYLCKDYYLGFMKLITNFLLNFQPPVSQCTGRPFVVFVPIARR